MTVVIKVADVRASLASLATGRWGAMVVIVCPHCSSFAVEPIGGKRWRCKDCGRHFEWGAQQWPPA